MNYKNRKYSFFQSSLRRRFFLYFVSLIVAVVFFISAAVYFFQYRMLFKEAQEKAFRLASVLAYSSLNAVLMDDYITLQTLIDGMSDGEDIRAIAILDTGGVVMASQNPGERGAKRIDVLTLEALRSDRMIQQKVPDVDEDLWDTAVPIFNLDQRVATARIKYSVENTYEGLLTTVGGIGSLAILLALVFSYHFSRTISDPIVQVADLAEEYGKGNLNASLNIEREDEIGQLVHTLNKLSDRLKALIDEKIANENLIVIGEFGAYIIHDLKNPLSGIHLLADGLHRRLPNDSPLKKYSEEILLASQRLEDFTRKTLNIARSANLKKSTVKINEIVESAVGEIQYRSQDIKYNLAENMPDINADYELLYMALKNLLNNAIDAVSFPGEVKVKTEQNGEYVHIKVEDSGSGIPNDRLTTIFRPFFSMKDEGHGLGLAMVKKIMIAHQGNVYVTSELGKGSCFTLSLPIYSY